MVAEALGFFDVVGGQKDGALGVFELRGDVLQVVSQLLGVRGLRLTAARVTVAAGRFIGVR